MSVDYRGNPATLDKRITLLKECIVKDMFGTPKSVWHPFTHVSASIEPLRGREYWQAAQANGESTVRIIIRYISGVTSRMRILYKSPEGEVTYEMKSPPINYREQNEFLELMVSEMSKNEPDE